MDKKYEKLVFIIIIIIIIIIIEVNVDLLSKTWQYNIRLDSAPGAIFCIDVPGVCEFFLLISVLVY